MEESFGLTWEDSTTVVQTEEVICGIENEIVPAETEEFTGVAEEETVIETPVHEIQTEETAPVERIMYLTDGNVLVMQDSNETGYQEQLMECQEEIVTGQWDESCPEEIVVGSEEAVGGTENANQEADDIQLPTDQDEYASQRPYPCDFCSRRFRKKGNLMNHMIAHQTDRPHGCNLCGVRYIRKSDLMNHLKIHAYIPETNELEEDVQTLEEFGNSEKIKKKPKQLGKRKKRDIKEESEEFDDENAGASSSRNYSYEEETKPEVYEYQQEEEEDEEEEEVRYPVTDPRKPFVCQHCGVAFAREKAMLSHTRLHAEGDSPFECQKCGDMFWDPEQMRDHARDKHGETEDFIDDDDDEDYSEEDTKYGTFYCTTCGLSFHRHDNLRRHQRVHVKEEFVNEHEFGHVCNVCGESFPEALDLLAHAEIHTRTVDYRCMICGEACSDESSLAVHVQAKHGKNLPPNTCMLCGRACKDRRTLLKHSWEHSKEKIYACNKCSKTFHNKARLKRHMLSHRNKVVNCDVCGEEFPDGRSLMNHRHSHSSVSGRQFPCRECGKTFGSRSSQQIHIRIHTGERPYGCRFCWKAFADGGTLRKHERIHTGEKPYACAVCPRAFNQRVVLREHIRSHHSGPDPKYTNSMTPYCCSVCSDMFAASKDLILHLIQHCDLNTALKRQPQVGPRKYKRRRKLKPHELEMMSSRMEDDTNDNNLDLLPYQGLDETFSDSEEEQDTRRRYNRKQKKSSMSPKEQPSDNFSELYSSLTSPTENLPPSTVNSKTTPTKNKPKKVDQTVPSRPKMIHTQKTRVPVETGEDGRIRHKTRTLVTRTQPAEIKSATGERIRPRTKNVSYHILNPDKPQLATFPTSDEATQQAIDSILREEDRKPSLETLERELEQRNGEVFIDNVEQTPEVAAEQIIESEVPVPVTVVKVRKSPRVTTRTGMTLRPGRHVIRPGSKVRLIKEGMIVSKSRTKIADPETIVPDKIASPPPIEAIVKEEVIQPFTMKQEIVDSSPLHELAEISMQHATANAQNLYKCEMCSEVFSDRAQLLVHVPIHI